jgi:molybdopterin-guanine dinucleotide biosynthesis protein MobB
MSIPVITIIGRSGCGKTTLIEKLIPELKKMGYRVGTVKHHSHPGFEVDQPGKDSWRHARAGSDYIMIIAPDKIASYRKVESELSLDEALSQVAGVDLILVEGYKSAGKPSIEIIRGVSNHEHVGKPEQLVAFASDTRLDLGLPVLDLNDPTGIAEFISARFL